MSGRPLNRAGSETEREKEKKHATFIYLHNEPTGCTLPSRELELNLRVPKPNKEQRGYQRPKQRAKGFSKQKKRKKRAKSLQLKKEKAPKKSKEQSGYLNKKKK